MSGYAVLFARTGYIDSVTVSEKRAAAAAEHINQLLGRDSAQVVPVVVRVERLARRSS